MRGVLEWTMALVGAFLMVSCGSSGPSTPADGGLDGSSSPDATASDPDGATRDGATDGGASADGGEAGAPDSGACPDDDGDGHRAQRCGGDDCDDEDPSRYPGNTEVCDRDGHDEDCNPDTLASPAERDGDGDGEVSADCCNMQPNGEMRCGNDCDDGDNTVNSEVSTDICNGGVDDDCDGDIDEDPQRTFQPDVDGDGHHDPEGDAVQRCAAPPGFTLADGEGDCDDSDRNINPSAPEVCDGRNNDCDEMTDEGVGTVCIEDVDEDGYVLSGARDMKVCDACPNGWIPESQVQAGEECDDTNPTVYEGAPELCDGTDNDCDETEDEDVVTHAWYIDADGDGHGDMNDTEPVMSCMDLSANRATNNEDCDDADENVNPTETETCDSTDRDCNGDPYDGRVSGELRMSCWTDNDGDGYAPSDAVAQLMCRCGAGFTDRDPSDAADCDDQMAALNPSNPELCGDDMDNDCDGDIDEPDASDAITCWSDPDDDGYARIGASTSQSCECPEGETDRAPDSDATTDCREDDPSVYPGAPERCDRKLNDCLSDHDYWTEDFDDDGYAPEDIQSCAGGFPQTDCNDDNERVHPNADWTHEPVPECPTGTELVSCADLSTETQRCISPLIDCSGCTPTDGTAPSSGSCDRGMLCDCYERVDSCEPDDSECTLDSASDANPPSQSFDLDCSGSVEPYPSLQGFVCGPYPEGCSTGNSCGTRGYPPCCVEDASWPDDCCNETTTFCKPSDVSCRSFPDCYKSISAEAECPETVFDYDPAAVACSEEAVRTRWSCLPGETNGDLICGCYEDTQATVPGCR